MGRSIVMVVVLFATLSAAGCDCSSSGECPSRGETRCNGSRAEICDADLRWQTFIECNELGPDWVCRGVDEGHTCVSRDDAFDGGSR